MEFRQARAEELPELKRRLQESGGEHIDLDAARVFVAVEGGKVIGMLPLRMTWQAEPLLIFPEVDHTHKRRRTGIGLYRAALAWLGDSSQNRTGIRWLFGITRKQACKVWLQKLGWHRQYKGAATFIKYV